MRGIILLILLTCGTLAYAQLPGIVALDVNQSVSSIENNLNSGSLNKSSLKNIITGTYPNPANESATLMFSLENASKGQVLVFNSLGQEMLESPKLSFLSGNNTYSLETSGLSNGIYFFTIQTEQAVKLTGRLLVKR